MSNFEQVAKAYPTTLTPKPRNARARAILLSCLVGARANKAQPKGAIQGDALAYGRDQLEQRGRARRLEQRPVRA